MSTNTIVSLENLSRYNDNIQLVIDDRIKTSIENIVPTKVSAFENDSNYVSLDVVKQMIADAIANLNKPVEPDTPTEPDVPVEPDTPTENIGSITEDNSIVIDETQLENGTYTLQYIDANDNIIDNFNKITSFEINN